MRRSTTTINALLTHLTGTGLARTSQVIGRIGRTRRARADRQEHQMLDLATVALIDDPDGTMRLIAVSGIAELHTIDAVAAALFDDPCTNVHLDLAGIAAWMPGVVRQLGRVLDDAELHGFRLRVIGLDPQVLTLSDELSA